VARRPRSGPWMERIELALATGLLIVALYYGRLGLGL
jgi:thiol:disulfide interchange protein